LDTQLPRGGLSVAIGEQFVADSAKLLGLKLDEKYSTSWDRASDLKTLKENYIAFKTLIDDFAAAVYAAHQSS
jgi:hypothetical protein